LLYLLDTNAVSDLFNSHPRVTQRVAGVPSSDRVETCTIVRGEILYVIEKTAPGKKRQVLEKNAGAVFAVLPCEPVPTSAADAYARVKHACRLAGVALDE
jgi:predicted nucleic acid-binding protein